MRKISRVFLVVLLLSVFTGSVSAIDINSSKSFQYFGDAATDGNLDFEINQTGHITVTGDIDMNNNRIQNFFAGAPSGDADTCAPGEFVQQVNPDGSYECDSASTSAGNTFVNVSGDAMVGMLNMTNNSINNVSYINEFGNTLRIGGLLTLGGNNIENVGDISGTNIIDSGEISNNAVASAEITDGAIAADDIGKAEVNTTHILDDVIMEADLNATNSASGGQFLTYDASGTGEFTWVDNPDNTIADDQDLSEVLVQGDVANRSINMSNNDIIHVANLYGDKAGTNSFFDASAGSASETVSSINADGTIQYSSILIGGTNVQSDSIDTYHIVNGTIVADDIAKNAVNATHIGTDAVDTDEIAQNAVGGSELDDSGDFTMGSLSVTNDATINGDLFVVGNISNTNVQELNVNGSILPPREFNGSFDIGSGDRMWQNGYFAGDLNVIGLTDGVNLDEPYHGIAVDSGSNGYTITLDGSTLSLSSSGLKVATGGITANEIASGAVQDDEIAKNSINTTQLESGAVATTNIQNGAVTSDEIAKNQVNRTHLEADAVGSAQLDETESYTVSGLDLQNNQIQNVRSVNDGDAVNKSYVDDQVSGATQDLSSVLSQGNTTGGRDIDLDGGSIRDSSGSEICIGDQCT